MRLLLPVGGLGRGSVFWKRQFAVPTIPGILVVELPTPAMTAVVTELPVTGRHLTGCSGSSPACCAAPSERQLSPIQPFAAERTTEQSARNSHPDSGVQ